MKHFLYRLYYIFLMPYLERARYFDILDEETEEECNRIAGDLINQKKLNEKS